MAKFNPPARTPLERTQTFEGGDAVRPKTMDELVFTAACTYVGEDTFYESKEERQARLIQLVRDATDKDPYAVARFVSDLRSKYLIRGASILVAAEFANRIREHGLPSTDRRHKLVRLVVNDACQRADEPAEFLAYWRERFGTQDGSRTRPGMTSGVKKGLAEACIRLYNERSALKYDSSQRQVRMGDVINLTRPKPTDEHQSELFKFLLDERHHKDGFEVIGEADNFDEGTRLNILAKHRMLSKMPEDRRRTMLTETGAKGLAQGGFTWERLSAWIPGGMDAKAWEAVIPTMGVFALIRNLRNFDDAGISDKMIDFVINKITNEEDVVASKIMPYRAYTAYKNTHSDNWKRALGKTVTLAARSVPQMPRSLILIDTSGSMQSQLSNRSVVTRAEIAALQAISVAKNSGGVDVVLYAERSVILDQVIPEWQRYPTLNSVVGIAGNLGVVGHSTMGHTAMVKHFDPLRHDRVILFTDDQQVDSYHNYHRYTTRGVDVSAIPQIITFNIGGYGTKTTWGKDRITVAGYSDQIFSVIGQLIFE